MKTKIFQNRAQMMVMLLAFLILLTMQKLVAQCTNPANVIYGLTGTGEIRPVTVASGAVAARINPDTGSVADLANAMGYNPATRRFYYFKRNTIGTGQQFVCYDGITRITTVLAPSPVPSNSIVNLGAVSSTGNGYYCLDAHGRFYYYRFASNSWTTVSSNLRDQYGVTLPNIISGGAAPTTSHRIYGDLAFDGSGNMWMLISGPTDFGLYKLPANVPTAVTATITIQRVLPPTTPSPGLQSIGGVAFTPTGQLLIATNAGDNRLYRMNNDYTLTYLSTMALDGVGTDLVSCNLPMFVLSSTFSDFQVRGEGDQATVAWTFSGGKETTAFIIEHSTDGNNWQQIGLVSNKGQQSGVESLRFTHEGIVNGKNYYRIAAIDINQRRSYSEQRMVITDRGSRISVFPTSASDKLHVVFPENKGLKANMIIYDYAGRQMYSTVLTQGTNTIDIRSLTAGSYFSRVVLTDGTAAIHRFQKNIR